LILVIIAIRVLFLYIVSPDITVFKDVWCDRFINVGRIDAFRDVFINYQPPLLYLIDFATLFRFIPKEISIKLIFIIFDFLAAFGVYKVLELNSPNLLQK
jgi:Gpi18-like mannosyltransferase